MKYKVGDIVYVNDINNHCIDHRFSSGDKVLIIETDKGDSSYVCELLDSLNGSDDKFQWISEICLTKQSLIIKKPKQFKVK